MRTTLLALFLVTVAAGSAAAADPACNALPSPNPSPIFISGSTALQPIFNVIGPKLAAQATNPYTIVYANTGSCTGVNSVYTDGLIKANASYYPASYDPSTGAKPPTCTIDSTAGVAGDLALSDVDGSLCPNPSPKPTDVSDFQGPVNDMVLVVPSTAMARNAISAEEVYLVFGKGADGGVMPWIDPMYYFIRTNTSGTRAMIAANSQLGSHNWLGVTMNSAGTSNGSGDVFTEVSGQQTLQPDKTLGILGEDFYDTGNNRASVKALAFRAFNQEKAYWPDSTVTAKDRQNVRDGHYKIWGYVHMLAKTTGGVPNSAAAKYFIDVMQGKATGLSFDIQDTITQSHLTPICAMHVTHDIEGADQKPFSPDAPCDCSFLATATGVATPAGCTACPSGTCSSGTCRKGFCESK
jgi:ABC-type phosphate transport system substrate-binding protein